MTVVIGFSFPEQSILAADTRAMLSLEPPEFDDEYQKILMTGYGLISGAGYGSLIQLVATWFAIQTPATNRDAADGIRRLVADMQPGPEAVRLTQWLTTYTTGDGENAQAGLAFICSQFNYNPQPVPTNSFHIVYPAGFAADDQQAVQAMVQDFMMTSLIPSPPAERRDPCIRAIDTVIRFVSERNNTVSNQYQVGFHHVTEGARISNIAGRPEDVAFPN